MGKLANVTRENVVAFCITRIKINIHRQLY